MTGFRIGPSGAEGPGVFGFQFGIFRRRNGGVAFAQGEGGFEGFKEAGLVFRGEREAVLDDVEDGMRPQTGGAGLVGANDLAVQQDTEVALGVEKGKQVFGLGIRGDGNGKSDEDGLAC